MTRFNQRVSSILLAAFLLAGGLAPQAIAQTPDPAIKQADAVYREGQAALARNDLDAAQADFERVIRLAPRVEQGYTALGTVLLQRGKPADAVRELELARTISRRVRRRRPFRSSPVWRPPRNCESKPCLRSRSPPTRALWRRRAT